MFIKELSNVIYHYIVYMITTVSSPFKPIVTLFDSCYTSSNTRSWHGAASSVMDCYATAQDLIPGWKGVKTDLHVLRKRQ